ncbi:unnamed protein product [Amoebophrya sp. A25]|nr:unnamed protein product [Amoebophrya sp. A25]|eukprot:GSA25T00022724001.1
MRRLLLASSVHYVVFGSRARRGNLNENCTPGERCEDETAEGSSKSTSVSKPSREGKEGAVGAEASARASYRTSADDAVHKGRLVVGSFTETNQKETMRRAFSSVVPSGKTNNLPKKDDRLKQAQDELVEVTRKLTEAEAKAEKSGPDTADKAKKLCSQGGCLIVPYVTGSGKLLMAKGEHVVGIHVKAAMARQLPRFADVIRFRYENVFSPDEDSDGDGDKTHQQSLKAARKQDFVLNNCLFPRWETIVKSELDARSPIHFEDCDSVRGSVELSGSLAFSVYKISISRTADAKDGLLTRATNLRKDCGFEHETHFQKVFKHIAKNLMNFVLTTNDGETNEMEIRCIVVKQQKSNLMLMLATFNRQDVHGDRNVIVRSFYSFV